MKSEEQMIRILIVDDHPVMRQGLAQIIEDLPDMEVCGEACGFKDAIQQFERLQPDIMTVDISLGDGTGLELIKEIKSRHAEARMLVLSMHDESLFGERVIRAGAAGFVNKNEPTEVLVNAMRHVLAGGIHASPRLTSRLLNQVATTRGSLQRSPIERLTDRELEVFELIGQGQITKQIAARLELSAKTVEKHRENIKAKLNLANSTELTRHAVQWVLESG